MRNKALLIKVLLGIHGFAIRGLSFCWLKYIDSSVGIGFVDFSKRRKKKSEPVNQPLFDQTANGTVGFAESTRANDH